MSFLTHILKKLLQVLLQLKEVDRGDEAIAGFGQAVSGQLSYLVVNEAEDAIGQRKNVLWRESLDELGQPALHLSRGLVENKRRGANTLGQRERDKHGERGERKKKRQRLSLEKDGISLEHPGLCDRKLRKQFHTWLKQCGPVTNSNTMSFFSLDVV